MLTGLRFDLSLTVFLLHSLFCRFQWTRLNIYATSAVLIIARQWPRRGIWRTLRASRALSIDPSIQLLGVAGSSYSAKERERKKKGRRGRKEKSRRKSTQEQPLLKGTTALVGHFLDCFVHIPVTSSSEAKEKLGVVYLRATTTRLVHPSWVRLDA